MTPKSRGSTSNQHLMTTNMYTRSCDTFLPPYNHGPSHTTRARCDILASIIDAENELLDVWQQNVPVQDGLRVTNAIRRMMENTKNVLCGCCGETLCEGTLATVRTSTPRGYKIATVSISAQSKLLVANTVRKVQRRWKRALSTTTIGTSGDPIKCVPLTQHCKFVLGVLKFVSKSTTSVCT